MAIMKIMTENNNERKPSYQYQPLAIIMANENINENLSMVILLAGNNISEA